MLPTSKVKQRRQLTLGRMAVFLIIKACCRSSRLPFRRCPETMLEYSTGTYTGLLPPLVLTQGILQHTEGGQEGTCVGS